MEHNLDPFAELKQAREEYNVYDSHYEKLGRVDDVFVDDADRALYVGVKMGLFGTNSTLIPTDIIRVNDRRRLIEVSEPADTIKHAPHFGSNDDLSPELENHVRTYFGLDPLRASPDHTSGGPYAPDAAAERLGPDIRVDTEPGERADEQERYLPPPEESAPRESVPREPVPREPVPREPVSREPTPREPMPREGVPREPTARESVPPEPMPRESVPREPVQGEGVPREPASRESIPREPVPRESVPREPAAREAIPREPVSRESIPREPVSREPMPREREPEPAPGGSGSREPLAEPPRESASRWERNETVSGTTLHRKRR